MVEIMTTMRSMRRLRPDPVPDELVRELIEAALCAPSAGHQQGQVFIVVTDRDRIAQLATVWRMVVDMYETWMAKADPRHGTDPLVIRTWDAVRYQRDHFHQTPVVIVACYDQRVYIRRVKRRIGDMVAALRMAGPRRAARMLLGGLIAIERRSEAASIYPAIQNLLLAARARGLAATMTTWHLFAEADVRRILEIPSNVRTYALIPIGWPLGRFGPVTRRPTNEVIRQDHWRPHDSNDPGVRCSVGSAWLEHATSAMSTLREHVRPHPHLVTASANTRNAARFRPRLSANVHMLGCILAARCR